MKKSKILKTALTVLMGSSIFNGATVYGSSHTTTQEAVGNQQIYLGEEIRLLQLIHQLLLLMGERSPETIWTSFQKHKCCILSRLIRLLAE